MFSILVSSIVDTIILFSFYPLVFWGEFLKNLVKAGDPLPRKVKAKFT